MTRLASNTEKVGSLYFLFASGDLACDIFHSVIYIRLADGISEDEEETFNPGRLGERRKGGAAEERK